MFNTKIGTVAYVNLTITRAQREAASVHFCLVREAIIYIGRSYCKSRAVQQR